MLIVVLGAIAGLQGSGSGFHLNQLSNQLNCIFSSFSPGFLRFVRVLCGMSSDERKAFLQFTTGCSTLPPGGLANLHPRLTVVRKVQTLANGESKWNLVTSGLKERNI